ncbi:MAG: type II secretion system F family protein [Nocardioides sp.]
MAFILLPLWTLGGLWTTPASAESSANIDHVQTAEDGTISVLLGVPPGVVPEPATIKVTLDDAPVLASAKTIKSGDIERTIILALDASLSMRDDKFAAAKQAAAVFLDSAPDDVRIGLISFSGEAKTVAEPTTDHDSLKAAIDGLALTKGTRVYDAVIAATELAGTEGARSILLLSDGKDEGGGQPIAAAITAAKDASVVVDVVALDQAPEDKALLEQIATSSGGGVLDADPTSLAETFKAQAEALASQLLVTFARPDGADDEVNLALSVESAGTTYSDSALVTLPAPTKDAAPRIGQGSAFGTPALVGGAIALALGMAGLLIIALTGATNKPSLAQRQVAHYVQAGRDAWGQTDPASVAKSGSTSLRTSAVAVTERLVKGDFESRLTTRLAGAGVQWTSAEWMLLHAGIAVSAGFVGLVLRGGLLMMLFFALGIAVPWLYITRRHSRRLANFDSQLPEMLQLTAGGLSAGLSMPQAIDTVVREGAEPMAGELRRAMVEQRLGVEITDALESVADRMRSQDFAWVVMAMRIQREVGGNLAELLNTVADTMRERDYLRRQVRVLSAEGRMSGWVLGGLPIAMLIYLSIFRPQFISPLFTTGIGILLLVLAATLLALGFFTLSRLVKIEV